MAAFGGYFDTGGAEHQGHFVVPVGVVASVEQWDKFDLRWLEVLRKYDIDSFHMTEIAHWAGDIGKWPLLPDGRRDEPEEGSSYRS